MILFNLNLIQLNLTDFPSIKQQPEPKLYIFTQFSRQTLPINCRLIRAITNWWPAKGPRTKQKSHKSNARWYGGMAKRGKYIPRREGAWQCNEKLITCGFLSCGHTHRLPEGQTDKRADRHTENPSRGRHAIPALKFCQGERTENFSFWPLPSASTWVTVSVSHFTLPTLRSPRNPGFRRN